MIVYNEIDVIDATINALLAAGFDRFIILDMMSTDGTADRVRHLLGQRATIVFYPRASLLKYGYAEARNVCAAFATRSWVLAIDADEVLVAGCQDNVILLTGEDRSSVLFSIARNNLMADPDVTTRTKTRTIERHNRLYAPSLRQKWRGYIHEEIFVDDASGWRRDGHTALVFDHYSELKPVADAESKAGLYAIMLIRGANQPSARVGTNAWHYDVYVPENRQLLESRALSYARKHNIDPSFYAVEPRPGATYLNDRLLRPVASPEAPEQLLDLSVVRQLHAVPASRWTKTSDLALWGEWNHPGEGTRSLFSIIDGMRSFHWDRFIKPGMVCIDIGGHSGDTAIPMGLFSYDAATKTRGHVIVVEPNPAVIPILNFNLALNTHIADFTSVRAAITSCDIDQIELSDHGNSECNGGVLDGGFSAAVGKQLRDISGVKYMARGISMTTLFAEIAKNVSSNPVGFIKIDCEGYDKEIIRHCRDLFSITRPVLFVEWFDWFSAEDDADLFSVIESLDYIAFHPVTLQPASPRERVSDLLCLHRDFDWEHSLTSPSEMHNA